MPTFGVIKYIRDELSEVLHNPQTTDKETNNAKYTMGMLHDILDRIDHTVSNRLIEKPPELILASIKVFAGAAAVIIMELAKEGMVDEAKETAVDQFKEQMEEALVIYKNVFETKKKDWL